MGFGVLVVEVVLAFYIFQCNPNQMRRGPDIQIMIWDFLKIRGYLLVVRILRFRVLYQGPPIFGKPPIGQCSSVETTVS